MLFRSIAPVSQRLAKKLVTQPLIAIGVKLRTRESIENWSPSAAQLQILEAKKANEAAKSKQADLGGIKPGMSPQ